MVISISIDFFQLKDKILKIPVTTFKEYALFFTRFFLFQALLFTVNFIFQIVFITRSDSLIHVTFS